MELQVLAVEGCPHVAEFEVRLAEALSGLEEATIRRRVVADETEAATAGMHGSPTLLVDGIDPFAAPGQATSLSCRLAATMPSAADLRRVLTADG